MKFFWILRTYFWRINFLLTTSKLLEILCSLSFNKLISLILIHYHKVDVVLFKLFCFCKHFTYFCCTGWANLSWMLEKEYNFCDFNVSLKIYFFQWKCGLWQFLYVRYKKYHLSNGNHFIAGKSCLFPMHISYRFSMF